tara:strand:- start:79109 stop:79594 length:486 start_codon:yes stop_codon:yes gene_type:complete
MNVEYFTLARVIHVVAVVIWIGGVAMVTTVILPAVKKMQSKRDKIDTFESLEGRFSLQAKVTTVLTAITGFYMIYELDAWHRYTESKYWWVTAMTLVWVLFTVVLFILEPFILHKLYKKYADKDPEKTFAFIQKFHWVLLSVSLLTIIGAVAGSHGLFFLE